MGKLDGRVAFVSGGSRGIGRAIAVALAAEGARVAINYFSNEAAAHEVIDAMLAARSERGQSADDGNQYLALQGDVSVAEQARGMVAHVAEQWGRLDVLVNNAGILRDAMSFSMTEAEFDDVIRVHLKGHFCTTHFAGGYWREQCKAGVAVQATIVNTASESGLYGNAAQANYAAAKAGIASMTIVVARELERYGVRVNAIAPVARTRLTEAIAGDYMAVKEGEFDKFAPENVAAVACWLASSLSAPLSGQVVKVQGGVAQLVQGWRPVTEATADKPWTIDGVQDVRAALLGESDGSIPPFWFQGPV